MFFVIGSTAMEAEIFILLSLAMIFYYTSVFLKYFNIFRTEYFLITLFGLLGMMIMISSQNMLLLYLGIELLSLSLYSVIAFNKFETKEICSICQDVYIINNNICRRLECMHYFHDACISEWLKHKLQCPICRYIITDN